MCVGSKERVAREREDWSKVQREKRGWSAVMRGTDTEGKRRGSACRGGQGKRGEGEEAQFSGDRVLYFAQCSLKVNRLTHTGAPESNKSLITSRSARANDITHTAPSARLSVCLSDCVCPTVSASGCLAVFAFNFASLCLYVISNVCPGFYMAGWLPLCLFILLV